ncbi:MAG: hypothetical protein V3U75_12885 [Methylococcaceae bacterium]
MERIMGPCPLGCDCEKAGKHSQTEEDVIIVCPWYFEITMQDPQAEKTFNEGQCLLVWNVRLLMENSKMSMGIQAEMQSLRNETAEGQVKMGQFLSGMGQAIIQAIETASQNTPKQLKEVA